MHRQLPAALVVAAGAAIALAGGCAQRGRGDAAPGLFARANEHDVQVPIEEVPAAARATIEGRLNGGTINEIERSTADGRTWYEVEVKTDTGMFDIAVSEDGSYLGMDDDGLDDDDDDEGPDDDGPDDDDDDDGPDDDDR